MSSSADFAYPLSGTTTVPHIADPIQLQDPAAWSLTKSFAQVGVGVMAVLLVLEGHKSLAMALAYALTAVTGIAIFAVADRTRFIEAWGYPESIEPAVAEPVDLHAQLVEQQAAIAWTALPVETLAMPIAEPAQEFRLNVT
jgi:hypothetical protein